MRILIVSQTPWNPSAYGKITYYVATGLKDLGYDIIVAGIEHRYGVLRYSGVPVFPLPMLHGKMLFKYIRVFSPDCVLSIIDAWAFAGVDELVRKYKVSWIAYTPVDAEIDSQAEPLLSVLRYARGIMTPSRFSTEQLRKFFVNVEWVPHGVNTRIFRPMNKEECKKTLRLEGKFVFGCVAANYSMRKDFPHLYKAFRIFLDMIPESECKDVVLFHHTWQPEFHRWGAEYNLVRLAKKYGIEKNLILPKEDIRYFPASEEQLALLYNAFDVYVTASMGEGFGIPLLESMACGTPCIAPANSAHVEHVEGRGWLVKKFSGWVVPLYNPLQLEYPIVDEHALAEAMYDAYTHQEKIKQFSKKCIEYASRYTWDFVLEKLEKALLKFLS